MLSDLRRFNRLCTELATGPDTEAHLISLEDFLKQQRFGQPFIDWYLLPMLACIWSCPTQQMLRFPLSTLLRFCHNHGLLQMANQPQWWTVSGGAKTYVEALLKSLNDVRLQSPVTGIARDPAGVRVKTPLYTERFNAVVLAVHSDQALGLIEQPTEGQRGVLSSIRYQTNRAVLHTDSGVMPKNKTVWSAWNYEAGKGLDPTRTEKPNQVCLHYWCNRLQNLPFAENVFVSLNPVRSIRPELILAEFDYEHPVFDLNAMNAQKRVAGIQGQNNIWLCGAWTGYGFHEDGLQSGYKAAVELLRHQVQLKAA
jgi:uncharacterized protein